LTNYSGGGGKNTSNTRGVRVSFITRGSHTGNRFTEISEFGWGCRSLSRGRCQRELQTETQERGKLGGNPWWSRVRRKYVGDAIGTRARQGSNEEEREFYTCREKRGGWRTLSYEYKLFQKVQGGRLEPKGGRAEREERSLTGGESPEKGLAERVFF